MKLGVAILFCVLVGFWSSGAMALCVVRPETFLRVGPGFEYPVSSWELDLYTPLEKLETWNNWYEVRDVDGDVHWVHMSEVREGEYCLTVKIDKTHLRRGPAPHYEILKEAKKYDSFRFVRRQGKWSQVANDAGEGFWLLSQAAWVQ